MIHRQIKLRSSAKLEARLDDWLWMLTGVWNWGVRKVEQDAEGGNYYFSKKDFQNLLAGHGKKIGIPSHTIQGMLSDVHVAWGRRFKKVAGKPRLKGNRNKLNSIPFPDPIKAPQGNYIKLPYLGMVRFHKQSLPEGNIKCARLIKRISGWYLYLFIDAKSNKIEQVSKNFVGIDPGFKNLLTLSNGEKIKHPRELENKAKRLAQAQRGGNKKLTARMHERIRNQRKDRNHKISRQLVSENELIAFSKDKHQAIARKFGKSVTSSSHGQLRYMLKYKSTASGTKYIEVNPAKSTLTCSTCGSLSGPTGWAGLSVRVWECMSCGDSHDRDINAAKNTLISALGMERRTDECYA